MMVAHPIGRGKTQILNTATGARLRAQAPRAVNKNRLTIRAATVRDINALVAIETACFGRNRPYRDHVFGESQFRYYLRSDHAVTLLATRNGTPVGSAIATVGRGTRSGSARILSIALIAGARRQGLGRRLLRRVVRELAAQGCERIVLEVADQAGAARALFRGEGFAAVRRLPDYYGRSMHGTRMALATGPRRRSKNRE